MGDTRLQGFRITSEELAGSPLAPNLLPILMHARLFGVPLEFINLVVALLFYCCSYAAAFWALSKAFSALFTFYLLIQATNVVYSYISFAILLRVYEAAALNARAAGLGQYLASTSSLLVYQPLVLLAIFTLTILCMVGRRRTAAGGDTAAIFSISHRSFYTPTVMASTRLVAAFESAN